MDICKKEFPENKRNKKVSSAKWIFVKKKNFQKNKRNKKVRLAPKWIFVKRTSRKLKE